MGSVLFVACTNVGESMIHAMMNTEGIQSKICGIVDLNIQQGASKANYRTYADIAQMYNIPIHYCNSVNDECTLSWIADKKPDVIIQTGWSQKFGSKLLSIPKYGCIGEHPAPLPKGRGAACVNWAILTGEKEWGDSFFEMVAEYDKGHLLAQGFFNIEEYDNVKTVYDKVAKTSADIVVREIDRWTEGCFSPIEQDDSKSTYYKRRTPADGVFTFDLPAEQLHNFLRAQTTPYPGAFVLNGSKRLYVLSSENTHTHSQLPVGTIVSMKNGCVDVVCGDGYIIRVCRVKPGNAPECWAAEYAAGKTAGVDLFI